MTYDPRVLTSLMPHHSREPHCKNCGEPFTPYRSWQEFCSPPCRSQYYERYVRHPYGKAIRALEKAKELDKLVPDEKAKLSDVKRKKGKNLGGG